MGKLNMKEWISQTIQRKETIAIPIMTHPGIEFIGKTVHDAVTNGQVHYEAIKALCDKYPAAAEKSLYIRRRHWEMLGMPLPLLRPDGSACTG